MVHFRVTPNCTGPYHYYPTNWLVVGFLIEMNSAGVVRFRVTPNFHHWLHSSYLLFQQQYPVLRGKADGGDQENHHVTQKTKKGTESSKEG